MLMEQGAAGLAFLGRRVARIFPLYFLATTAAYLVSCLIPSARASGNIPTPADYLKSVVFIPHAARNGEIVPVLGVGWTLNYEMAFYLCCTAACLITARHRALWAGLLAVACATAFGAVFPCSSSGKFYSNPIVIEFVAGLCVWSVCSRLEISLRSISWLFIATALICFMSWSELANVRLIADVGRWSRPVRYLLPACLLVGLGFLAESAFQRVHAGVRRLIVLIGDASYAIYLTHLFVLGIVSLVFTNFGVSVMSSGFGSAFACLVSVAVGILIYQWVEVPTQKLLRPAVAVKV